MILLGVLCPLDGLLHLLPREATHLEDLPCLHHPTQILPKNSWFIKLSFELLGKSVFTF